MRRTFKWPGFFSKEETRSKGCFLCPLNHDRGIAVPNIDYGSEVMFLGGVPSIDDCDQATPFVGKPGQLLDRELVSAGFIENGGDRNISVGNILQCRPVDTSNKGHEPIPAELKSCGDHLHTYIEEASPKVIVALGTIALKGLIGSRKLGIVDLRGRVFWYQDKEIFVVSTYHPVYILRELYRNAYRGNRMLVQFREDLQLAYELQSVPFPKFFTVVANRPSLAIRLLKLIKKQTCTSIDVEGQLNSAYIACLAFSSEYGDSSVVIPVEHPESKLLARISYIRKFGN